MSKVRIAYRAHAHLVIWEVIRAAGIWDEVGLEPELHLEPEAYRAEAALFGGEINFISGNHITPYVRRAEGIPMLYLAQPFKATDDVVVSREPIQSLVDLRGKRIADRPLFAADGKDLCHPRGNHVLYLERGGVRANEVIWFEDDDRGARAQIAALVQGAADAAFVGPSYAPSAQEQGLSVLPLEPLPMVVGPTITGFAPHLRPNPDLGERMIRALAMGVRRFLDDRPGSLEVIERDVAPHMRLKGAEGIIKLYEKTAASIEPSLYPSLEGVLNAYKLAQMLDAEKVSHINPLSAWDLHYLQQLEESGFFAELAQPARA